MRVPEWSAKRPSEQVKCKPYDRGARTANGMSQRDHNDDTETTLMVGNWLCTEFLTSRTPATACYSTPAPTMHNFRQGNNKERFAKQRRSSRRETDELKG